MLLGFAEAKIGKAPTRLILADLNAQLILDFLDHLEKERSNGVRTRNARGEVIVDGAAVAHLHGKGRKDRSVPLWRTTVGLIVSATSIPRLSSVDGGGAVRCFRTSALRALA